MFFVSRFINNLKIWLRCNLSCLGWEALIIGAVGAVLVCGSMPLFDMVSRYLVQLVLAFNIFYRLK